MNRESLLHPCAEVPTKDTLFDEGCEEFLLKNYTFVKRLGALTDGEFTGASGIAMELVSAKGETVVAKLMGMDTENARYSINDIAVGCRLNNIADQTPIFIETFGWLRCKTYPTDWKTLSGREPAKYDESNGILMEFISHGSRALSDMDIVFSMKEYIEMTIIILHGLMIADSFMGFKHNDIHVDQILLNPVNPGSDSLQLDFGESGVFSFTPRFIPVLIDYGHSTIPGSGFTTPSRTDDADDLLMTLKNRIFAQWDAHGNTPAMTRVEAEAFKAFWRRVRGKPTAKGALADPYITEFLNQQLILGKINPPPPTYIYRSTSECLSMRRCKVCGTYTNRRCGRCKNVHFCGKECARKGWFEGGHKLECTPIGSSLNLEDLYVQYTGGNKNQRVAYAWLLEKRLSSSWNSRMSVKESWRTFLKSPAVRGVPTRENDDDAYRILAAFEIPRQGDRSSGDFSELGQRLKKTMQADAVIDTFERSAKDNEGETAAKIVDTIVDEVEEGVERALDSKVDEIKDVTLELERRLKSTELTMLGMDKELKELRALIPKHEKRERFLQTALDECRNDWKQSRQTSGSPPPSLTGGPPPPPPPPTPSVINLPTKPLEGLTTLVSEVKLKTTEITPAAKKGAERTENALLSQIEKFAKGKLKKVPTSASGTKKPPPQGGLMGGLAAALAKRRKGIGPGKEETEEEKRASDAEFDLIPEQLVMDVIQGKYFRERTRAVIGDRFFV
jgi:hypothetical protein